MKNFKRNYKRNRYRNNGEKNYQKNGGVQKLNSDIAIGFSFRRINQNRNNQNARFLADVCIVFGRRWQRFCLMVPLAS